jgi:hypothetical protein
VSTAERRPGRSSLRLQMSTRASVRENREHGTKMLMFSFHLGPLEVFCLTHLPSPGEAYSKTYVKVGLRQRALMEGGKRVEAWELDEVGDPGDASDEGATSTPGHAKVSGGIPGARVLTDLRLGPLRLVIDGDGQVRATLAPRRTFEEDKGVVEHWEVAR